MTVLARLLFLVAEGRVTDVAALARELGVSSALVETMLEDLTRRGLLDNVAPAVCRTCAVRWCPRRGSDATAAWVLTAEGRRWARAIEEMGAEEERRVARA